MIGANAYGDRKVPGASYGLVRDTDTRGGTAGDDRFLRSARKVLKPGGTARLMARSNYLQNDPRLEETEPRLKLTNKYLDPEPTHIREAAKLKFDVTTRPADQPKSVHFFRPDTHPGKQKELGEYNTQFEFKKRNKRGRKLNVPRPPENDDSESDGKPSSDDEFNKALLRDINDKAGVSRSRSSSDDEEDSESASG